MKGPFYQMRVAFPLVFFASVCINGLVPISWVKPMRSSGSHLSSSYSSDDNPFTRTVAPEVPLSTDVSQLPDTFSDAIRKAAMRTLACITSGKKRIRIDFDTSIGDQTYTSIKNTIPMMKELSIILSQEMDLTMTMGDDDEEEAAADAALAKSFEDLVIKDSPGASTAETVAAVIATPVVAIPAASIAETAEKTMRIFFPDMGQAALARRDWKMGSEVSEVPPCVYTANIKNDELASTDKIAVILCPLASEADSVKRIMDMCTEANVPLIMINPDLINMDQGFGYRARNLRKDVLGTFSTSYKLKTMETGALVREWPMGYSVWNEDQTAPDGSGYRLLQTYKNDPSREMMNELYDAANPEDGSEGKAPKGPNPALSAISGTISGVVDFFQGMSKL